eukprot:PhM_4_TR13264/c0_g1_i1/m.23739/K15289/SLC35F5; solute carrier family 35, member F5
MHLILRCILFGTMALSLVLEAESGQCVQLGECLGAVAYNNPALMILWNHTLLGVLCVIPTVWYIRKTNNEQNSENPHVRMEDEDDVNNQNNSGNQTMQATSVHLGRPLLWGLCLAVAVCSFMLDYVWFQSFKRTSVAEGSTLVQSVCVFALILSVCLGIERLNVQRVCAVIGIIAGVFVMMRQDLSRGSAPSSHLVGNCLALLTGFMQALYEVGLAHSDKKFLSCGLNTSKLVPTFSVGVFAGVCYFVIAPVVIAFVWLMPESTGVHESLSLPTMSTLPALLANSLFSNLFNILLILGVALTSPTDVAVGCALESPMGMIFDVAVRGVSLRFDQVAGAAIIVSCFLWLSFQPHNANNSTNNDAPSSAVDGSHQNQRSSVAGDHRVEEMRHVPVNLDVSAGDDVI